MFIYSIKLNILDDPQAISTFVMTSKDDRKDITEKSIMYKYENKT